MTLYIAPIVEGHGEVKSIEKLLHRVWKDIHDTPRRLQVLEPFRPKRDQFLQEDGVVLAREVQKASLKLLQKVCAEPLSLGVVLIFIDTEELCPAATAPALLSKAQETRSNINFSCVLPCKMFENWFLASADSLSGINGLPDSLVPPEACETINGKYWIDTKIREVKPNRCYSETVDGPEFVKAMNLGQVRDRSDSFDKLCREFAKWAAMTVPVQEDTVTEQ